MGEPLTIGKLLMQKKTNLFNYVSEILKNEDVIRELSEHELNTFDYKINKFNETDVHPFLYFINKSIVPNKKRLDTYINEFLCANGISKTSFLLNDEMLKDHKPIFMECKNKIKSYLKLFIDIIEYSFDDDDQDDKVTEVIEKPTEIINEPPVITDVSENKE